MYVVYYTAHQTNKNIDKCMNDKSFSITSFIDKNDMKSVFFL